jgi:hypothetical protein
MGGLYAYHVTKSYDENLLCSMGPDFEVIINK